MDEETTPNTANRSVDEFGEQIPQQQGRQDDDPREDAGGQEAGGHEEAKESNGGLLEDAKHLGSDLKDKFKL